MNEFTGERVVPGQVNVDLWNEHVSRYAFAARYVAGRNVLDIGSGSGYGSAELARTAASVTGIDLAGEAVQYARINYPLENLRFTQGSAARLPFRGGAFHVITAFEVIEHLADWRNLIDEALRVLAPDGLFLVSTPNLLYYAQSREQDGPNPYHEHEFTFEEFRQALVETFPSVNVLMQNRAECQVFYPAGTFWPADVKMDATGGTPAQANFFLALCSRNEATARRSFAYVPKAANILREREEHIAKLQGELKLNQGWLAETRAELTALLDAHAALKAHLEEQNRWAMKLEAEWKAAQQRIVELQDQFAAEQKAALEVARNYEAKIVDLEADATAKAQWALDTEQRLTAEVEHHKAQIVELLARLEQTDVSLEERTRWALSLQEQNALLDAKLAGVRLSRWVKTGRILGVGPQV